MPYSETRKHLVWDFAAIAIAVLAAASLGVWLLLTLFKADGEKPEGPKASEVPLSEEEPTIESSAAPAPKTVRFETLILPEDSKRLAQETTYRLHGYSFERLVLRFEKAESSIEVLVRAGTMITPLDNPNLATYYVWKMAEARIDPQEHYPVGIEVVVVDSEKLKSPPQDDGFQFIDAGSEDRIAQFVRRASEKELSWGSVQSGVWMLSQDILPEYFKSIHISVANSVAPTSGRERVVASYGELKAASKVFSDMGLEPGHSPSLQPSKRTPISLNFFGTDWSTRLESSPGSAVKIKKPFSTTGSVPSAGTAWRLIKPYFAKSPIHSLPRPTPSSSRRSKKPSLTTFERSIAPFTRLRNIPTANSPSRRSGISLSTIRKLIFASQPSFKARTLPTNGLRSTIFRGAGVIRTPSIFSNLTATTPS